MAARQGLRLVKSPRRDRYADGYGTYRLVGAVHGEHVCGDAVSGYGMDLDAVEAHLTSRPVAASNTHPGASGGAGSELTVTVSHLDGHAEVVLIGELDFASAGQLRHTLDKLINQGHRDLRINITALAFLDAAGIGALTAIRARLENRGGRLTLVGIRGIPRRALIACGLFDVFTPDQNATISTPPARNERTK